MKGSIGARLRLWAIFNELGYIPWKGPRGRKGRSGHDGEPKERRKGVYVGAREAIPFLNDDAKRTLSHLLLRPGYMMRDYILRGQHGRYLAPFTALLVFYSVFTLILAVVQPRFTVGSDDDFTEGVHVAFSADSTERDNRAGLLLKSVIETVQEATTLMQLDIKPEAVDAPWKASLAAIEGDLRNKGIPLFLGSFLLLWIATSIILRKYDISVSGAAALSAYVLCQFCIFMFLALLLSLGRRSELGLLLMAVLLFIDFRQMLGIGNKKAFWLTVRCGLVYLAVLVILILLISLGLYLHAVFQVGNVRS